MDDAGLKGLGLCFPRKLVRQTSVACGIEQQQQREIWVDDTVGIVWFVLMVELIELIELRSKRVNEKV